MVNLLQEDVMVIKVYITICTMLATAAATLFVTGNFTAIVAVVLGFVAFGAVFMGMMFVLPFTATHPAPTRIKAEPSQDRVAVPSYGGTRTDDLSAGLVHHAR